MGEGEGEVHGHVFLRHFTAVGGMGAYSVKYGNKRLEDKNNSNDIILTGIFLKVKETFLFLLDIQKGGGGRSHLTTSPLAPRDASALSDEKYSTLEKTFRISARSCKFTFSLTRINSCIKKIPLL